MAEMWTVVDAQLRPRINTTDNQSDAIIAGTAALLLIDDQAWSVMQVLPGRPLGSENYDSLTADNFAWGGFCYPPLDQVVPTNFHRNMFPTPYRFLKFGELRFVSAGVVTFFPLTPPPDGEKREDT